MPQRFNIVKLPGILHILVPGGLFMINWPTRKIKRIGIQFLAGQFPLPRRRRGKRHVSPSRR